MLLILLADSKDYPIDEILLSNILSLLIKLLEGGNKKVQKRIYLFFKENSKSEIIFEFFYKIFNENIDFLRNFYEVPLIKDEIINKTLSTIQLLVEGHNNELQNYLRSQIYSQNNYDIMHQIIETLYSYELLQKNYENILKCFDTLIELVQVN